MRHHAGVILLLSASFVATAQEADTLVSSRISAARVYDVAPPAEEVFLPSVAAAPTNVAAVLSRFTGVQVKDYGGVGGLKTVNVRSLGSEHTGIFLDGIQVDNAQNMQVDIGRFSTDGIGSVTLFTGQKAQRLQTAKEYISGASVHIGSAPPLSGKAFGGRARFRGGSFGTIDPSIQLDKSFGRVALRAGAEYIRSNGRYLFPCFDTTLVRENSDIQSLRLESQLFAALPLGEINFRVYAYGSERGFPGPVIRRALGFPFSAERQSDQDFFVQGGWTREWSELYSTALRLKYSNSYTHYNNHAEKNPMVLPLEVYYRQSGYYASLAQSFIIAQPCSVDLSLDAQHNSLKSDVGMFVNPHRTTLTGALATRLILEKFRAAAHIAWIGAWDKYKTPNAGGWSRKDSFRNEWIPSVSLFYTPWKWLELDAFTKRSYRLPSFNDLYYTQIGNSALVPESALQLGGGVRINGSSGAFRGELRLSPYYNTIDNKIVAVPTSSQFRWSMQNLGKVEVTGVDVKVEGGFSLGDFDALLLLRYSWQKAIDKSHPEYPSYGGQIPYVPLHSGSIDLNLRWRKLSFSWNTVLTGERWSSSANIEDYHIDPWSITDIALSWTLWKDRLTVGVNCNNLFNQSYQIVQGYPMPGLSLLGFLEFRL